MKNIINNIKDLSLEQINKNLIFVAICALFFRIGNFSSSHLPKPFELIVIVIIFIAIFDFIKNKKFKEFYYSFSKNIRISLFCLVLSVLIGWGISVLNGTPTTFNTILEFVTFIFSLTIFILILFYTRNDKLYIKKYLYALLVPIIYIIFILIPELAYNFNLALGTHFVGLTGNPNIVSKILLIPAIFFIVKTLFEEKNKWFKLGYFILSFFSASLLFWTSSRGAILSLIIGMIFIWLMFSLNNFNWKKLFKSGIIILFICIIGFLFSPYGVKSVVIDRVSNTQIRNINNSSELRLQIWSFYLKYLSENPLGIGPNTHKYFGLIDKDGNSVNTGPHNTYLQIWLWGGIFAFLIFMYLFYITFKNLILKLKSDYNIITFALLSILFALSVSIMFDDSLSSYWYFIILALSLRI